MTESCYCTFVHPDGRTVTHPESVNPLCPLHGEVRAAVERQVAEVDAAIERACEQALQLGDRGVLVLTKNNIPVEVGPHPDVPYGQIHYRPAP